MTSAQVMYGPIDQTPRLPKPFAEDWVLLRVDAARRHWCADNEAVVLPTCRSPPIIAGMSGDGPAFPGKRLPYTPTVRPNRRHQRDQRRFPGCGG